MFVGSAIFILFLIFFRIPFSPNTAALQKLLTDLSSFPDSGQAQCVACDLTDHTYCTEHRSLWFKVLHLKPKKIIKRHRKINLGHKYNFLTSKNETKHDLFI